MSKRKKYTAEEKAEIVLEYLNTNIFMNEVLKKYSISHETLLSGDVNMKILEQMH